MRYPGRRVRFRTSLFRSEQVSAAKPSQNGPETALTIAQPVKLESDFAGGPQTCATHNSLPTNAMRSLCWCTRSIPSLTDCLALHCVAALRMQS